MPRRSTPPRRRTLNREAIVAKALEIADTEGIDHVSFRRLAADFGVTPMALYTHVRDKSDLLDALADYVLDFVLPKYKAVDSPPNWTWPKPIDKDENLADIKVVALALRLTTMDKKGRLVERVRATYFLWAMTTVDETVRICTPSQT